MRGVRYYRHFVEPRGQICLHLLPTLSQGPFYRIQFLFTPSSITRIDVLCKGSKALKVVSQASDCRKISISRVLGRAIKAQLVKMLSHFGFKISWQAWGRGVNQ